MADHVIQDAKHRVDLFEGYGKQALKEGEHDHNAEDMLAKVVNSTPQDERQQVTAELNKRNEEATRRHLPQIHVIFNPGNSLVEVDSGKPKAMIQRVVFNTTNGSAQGVKILKNSVVSIQPPS
jgi:hypothetical protein